MKAETRWEVDAGKYFIWFVEYPLSANKQDVWQIIHKSTGDIVLSTPDLHEVIYTVSGLQSSDISITVPVRSYQ